MTYGIAIVGGGRVAHAHARAIQSLPDLFALRAIVDTDPQRATALAAQYGCDGMTDFQRVLERADVAVVAIGTPNHLHAPMTRAAITAGKHVFVEKPMALTLDDCDSMIAAARAAGVKLLVGQTQHFFANNIRAHQIISAGELGQLAMLSDTWYKPFGIEQRLPWFLDRAFGGGMWHMNGAHMVDRMLWFAGSPVVAVKAWIGSPLLQQASDDAAMVFLQHASGLCSTIVHAGYRVGVERWEAEFVCTDGMLKLSTFAPNRGLWVSRDGGYTAIDTEEHNPFAYELALFGAAIRDDTPEPIAPDYARQIVAVLLAAEQSVASGREVLLG